MSILITGGSGFIGSCLLSELEKKNTKITLLGRYNPLNHKNFFCDFLKDEIPDIAFNNIETVFHLAGCAHDTSAKKLNKKYIKINTEAVFEMARISIKKNIKNFVFLSSVKAANPKDIYGLSKKQAEDYLLEISKNTDMNIIIIRSALVYGNKVKGNLELMIKGIEQGWFPPLPETNNKRSMIHVEDLVSALLFLSNKPKLKDKIFIATDGKNYSTAEIYDTLCMVVGKKIPKWRFPKFFFDFISFFHPILKFKVEKLFGNDFYSSEKLFKLGFRPQKELKDILVVNSGN